MSYRRMKVYTCDICGRKAIADRHWYTKYESGTFVQDSYMGEPEGWKHRGWRNGVTICDKCRKV